MLASPGAAQTLWRQAEIDEGPTTPPDLPQVPSSFQRVVLDPVELEQRLRLLAADSDATVQLELPLPDGSFPRFRIASSSIMEPELAAAYPDLRTYAGNGIDDRTASVRLDWTPSGLNAIILCAGGTFFVAPHSPGEQVFHVAYDYHDLPHEPWVCDTDHEQPKLGIPGYKAGPYTAGSTVRLYRLAVATSGEYAASHGGTVASTLANVVTRVNQLNAIYERDFSIRLVLIGENDQIIYTDGGTDPFLDDGSNELATNQTNTDSVIGTANYDVGHLFLENYGGGVATLSSACNSSWKARGQNGGENLGTFCHEMAHQFSATHTWNSLVCDTAYPGQWESTTAFEPGSGSTMMGYPGACGADNITTTRDLEFHVGSFDQVMAYASEGGGTCAIEFDPGLNTAPVVNAGSRDFTLPNSTPFVLSGSASDAEGDSLTYSWQEMDLAGASSSPPSGDVPFFRAFARTSTADRTFPQIGDVVTGTATKGEEIPTTAKSLSFRLEAHDSHSEAGGVAYDEIDLDIDGSAGPFQVTAPNTAVTWIFASTPTVTWNVASTDASPILCSQVDIDLSLDGGYTYPISLAAGTANDGSETVTAPSNATSTARVRVRCSLQRNTADTADVTDHFFFDISDVDFTISPDLTGCVTSTVVKSLADAGVCTLRDSILNAGGGATITFDSTIAGSTIHLASQISITKNVTIDGTTRNITISGDTDNDGTGDTRIFDLQSFISLTLNKITLSHGRIDDSGTSDEHGGCIYMRSLFATLNINDSTLTDCYAYRRGGAIYNNQGTLTMNRSTIANSEGGGGGAIYSSNGTYNLYNTTISGNTARWTGWGAGGIYTTGFSGGLTLVNCTITGNQAPAASDGGGLNNALMSCSITNTIIANSPSGDDCVNTGVIGTNTNNLIEDGTCPGFIGFQTGDPNLGPLQANGGETDTHAVYPPSAAIENGDPTGCSSGSVGNIDQRGYTRPGGAICDIGAFEVGAAGPAGAPSITAGQVFSVDEQETIGTAVGVVLATDPNVPPEILTYSIVYGNTDDAFAVNPATGQLTVNRSQPLDYPTNPQFLLGIEVIDNANPPLADIDTVTVNVNDINLAPTVDNAAFSVASTAENGVFVGYVTASDPDPGDKLTYTITAGNTGNAFSIDSDTGDLYVNNNAQFGSFPSFSLTVQVTDDGSPNLSDTATVNINVTCSSTGLVVSSTADSGQCTLRQIVADASSGDTITFDSTIYGSTITLSTGEILIDKDLTIDGDGANMTIDGGGARIFYTYNSGSTLSVALQGLTLRNGDATGAASYNEQGGAVMNCGELVTISRCTITNNSGSSFGVIGQNCGNGYTIEDTTFSGNSTTNRGSCLYLVNGTTTINSSTLSGNTSSFEGGAIYLQGGTLNLYNSTFSGNSGSNGGAVYNGGGTVTMYNSTLAGNSAGTAANLNNGSGTLNFRNSIIADATGGGADCANAGTIGDNINNMVEDGTCSTGATGFQTGDPNLGTLQNNGGDTSTQALQSPSNAIDNGDNTTCALAVIDSEDQRHYGRTDATCDIGAYEYNATYATPTWDGGGSTQNWSEAANWVGDQVPGASDIVLFDVTSRKESIVDAGFAGTVAGMIVAEGYKSTVTLARNLAVTGNLSVGLLTTVDLSTYQLTVDGTVTNNGTLIQTQAATVVDTTVEFLTIKNAAATATNYYGIDVTPTASSMGNVTVEVWGNQYRCGGSSNDPLIKRCVDVSPDNQVEATIKLYYSEAERNNQLANQLKMWHYNTGLTQWEAAGTDYTRSESDWICLSGQTQGCWIQATTISSYSQFGAGSGDVPTSDGPLPVSLAAFTATRSGEVVDFVWSTATETGTAGFHLWVQTPQGRRRVNNELIPARGVDSFTPLSYRYQAPVADGDTFLVEDVDLLGRRRLHGPYAIDRSYGQQPQPVPIDWPQIRSRHQQQQVERARAKVAAPPAVPIRLLVDHDGLYRVTWDDLQAAGFDLTGVALSDLAVTNRGQPVPIRVRGAGATFAPGDFIELWGEGLDTLYTTTNVYHLSVDPASALRIPVETGTPDPGIPAAAYYLETSRVDNPQRYSNSSPTGDPWYHERIFASSGPVQVELPLTVDNLLAGAATATFQVAGFGMTATSELPDHHLEAYLNGAHLGDVLFDGMVATSLSTDLSPGILLEGANTVTLRLPLDTGAGWDMVAVSRYQVTYPRAFVASQGTLTFTAAGQRFEVQGLASTDVVVYRQLDGTVTRLAGLDTLQVEIFSDGFESGDRSAWSSGTPSSAKTAKAVTGYRLSFVGTAQPATYRVSTAAALLTPGIEAGRTPVDITSGSADYLMISHPDYLAGLAPLVAARQAEGWNVREVDVFDVYDQFNHGILDPQAISDYVQHAATAMGASTFLLVGGDTYDYHDYLGTGAISFIPSLYAQTDELVFFAPVDPLFTDIDGDQLPDLPIGRLPVRTAAELDQVVAKTLAYAGKDYSRTAMFTADLSDAEDLFSVDSDEMISRLPVGWVSDRAYLDDLEVAVARQALVDAIEAGVAMVNFVGHSASTEWTFEGLFTAADAAVLANTGQPTLVTQWGCWNTWYVATGYETMADSFLLSGNGAAAVLGATTLTDSSSDRALGQRVTERLAQPGVTVGEAIQAAKADLAVSEPLRTDVLLGWTLLGDPTLVVEP